MAEAAYAASPTLLAILGGPALFPKKFLLDVKSKSIVSYLEVSQIPTISSIRHAAYQLGD